MTLSTSARAATPTYYADRTAFEVALEVSVLDDYDSGYAHSQSDAAMSAVRGETDYRATGWPNTNIVSGGYYCSGCNGSFELSFQTTTIGASDGVEAVGFKVIVSSPAYPFFAHISFADGTTTDVQLPQAGNFWGVMAPERIEKIHFGLAGGGATTTGSFGIDDLIIGEVQCFADTDCPDDADPCTGPSCSAGVCGFSNRPDGEPCDDANACTQVDACLSGVCTGTDPVVCTAADPCHEVGICDPTSGTCSSPVAPDNTACNDDDACTTNDTCQGGSCMPGADVSCNDGNECTSDTCDAIAGCQNAPVADDTPCDDNNACNSGDRCMAGVCEAMQGLDCDDGNSCSTDSCDVVGGCVHTELSDGAACTDFDACTINDACQQGQCVGSAAECDDHNNCTADSCDAVGGCTHENLADGETCSDGNGCTEGDTCQAGACVSGAVMDCIPEECQVSVGCDAATGQCQFENKADGASCDEGRCETGVCVPNGTGGAGGEAGAAGSAGEAGGEAGAAGQGGSPVDGGSAGSGNAGGGDADGGLPSADDSGDDSGCGCRAAGQAPIGASWLVALALGFLAKRRRNRAAKTN